MSLTTALTHWGRGPGTTFHLQRLKLCSQGSYTKDQGFNIQDYMNMLSRSFLFVVKQVSVWGGSGVGGRCISNLEKNWIG